jgi:hypothetical protein
MANGIPATAAMTYSGTLEDPSGAPLGGTKSIGLTFWDQAANGTSQCSVPPSQLALDQGRFDIILPDTCTAAVKANPDLWIEITVDGASLGRSKAGAVPYAVEAAHAVNSDTAANATNATKATTATNATSATNATNATNATTAATANAAGGALDTRIAAVEAKKVTITAWAAYTPNVTQTAPGGGSTPSNLVATGYYRRVGDTIEVTISTQTSACTPGILLWDLPSGLAYDNTRITDYDPVLGSAEVVTSANAPTTGVVIGQQGTHTTVGVAITGSNPVGIICATAGDGGIIRMHFSAPIKGWTVSG